MSCKKEYKKIKTKIYKKNTKRKTQKNDYNFYNSRTGGNWSLLENTKK